MKEMVKISLIIPYYKGNKYLERLIRIFDNNCNNFKQDYNESFFEMIIVNDCPTDIVSIPHEYERNIRIINNEKNLGIQRSKIVGVLNAVGDYICFLDQDDLISDYYFVNQYRLIQDCDGVICNAAWGYGELYTTGTSRYFGLDEFLKGENQIISLGQLFVKAEVIPEEWKNKPLLINGADDYYLMVMMLYKNNRIKVHDKILYYHVDSRKNISTDTTLMKDSVVNMADNLINMGMIEETEHKIITDYWISKLNKHDTKDWENPDNRLLHLIDLWMEHIEKEITLDTYLDTFDAKKIAIYGAGHLGRRLAFWLKRTPKIVSCFIDQNANGIIDGVQIYKPQKTPKELFDTIVVTPINNTDDIVDNLSAVYSCTILTLEELIYNATCVKLI